MNVLVIAAHPDDEVLGCGGTMARLAANGDRVDVLILGEGITSRSRNREEAHQDDIAELHNHARSANEGLGVTAVTLLSLPDNRFDSLPLLDVVKHIEDAIARFEPEMIFTQHGGDLNFDHVITYRATLIATRPMRETTVRRVLSYEVASSTEWAFQKFDPQFRPTVFYDISGTLDLKLAAMQSYDTETREFPHPRSPLALTSIARRWGSTVGVEAAEAFELVREIIR